MTTAQHTASRAADPGPAAATADGRRLVRGWLPVALVSGLFAVVVRVTATPLGNSDTYFHLRYGREFLTGEWSLQDPGSVSSFGTADWVPTQWLPQVAMAWTERTLGLAGVAWLSGLQVLGLVCALYLVCRRWSAPLPAAAVTFLAASACLPGLTMRPQVISYVLTLVTTAAWLRARESGRVPWLLVPMTWVWTMCHGMWPIGVVVSAVAVVGLLLDADERPSWRTCARWAAVPALSAATVLVTPAGPGLLGAVVEVGSRGDYFAEWGPPDFTRWFCLALLALLAVGVLPRLRAGRSPWLDVLLLGLAAGLAVMSLRTVPVAACVAAPLAAVGLATRWDRDRVALPDRRLIVGAFVASLAVLAVVVPQTSDAPRAAPAWEADALGGLPPGTAVVSSWGTGSWLMWRYPQLDVVAHGYGDAFTDAELQRNFDITRLEPGWVEELQATGAELALATTDTPFAYGLEQLGWVVVHTSPDETLLRAPADWAGR